MKKSIHRKATCVCLFAIALMNAGHAFAQTVGEAAASKSPATSTERLQWKFKVGDVIELQQHIVETLLDGSGQLLQNTRDYHCLWTVTDVAADGMATIDVKPTLIRLDLDFPPLAFDSEHDDPTFASDEFFAVRRWIYQARSMANAGFSFKVHSTGGIHSTWGALPRAESIPAAAFMTGDMPALPKKTVSLGQSWTIDVGTLASGHDQKGRATYRFVGKESVQGRNVCRIEGTAHWAKIHGQFGTITPEPTISVSHFDVDGGRFLNEEVTGGGQFENQSGESTSMRQRITRRLALVTPQSRESVKSGEYVFAFEGDKVHYLQIAGLRQETQAPISADQAMYVALYHDWNDVNQDKQPDPTELSDLTTQFTEEEGLRFFVNTLGMQDADVRAEVVNSEGVVITTIPVRIVPGPAAFAVRHLSGVEAGVYFLEWYVNGTFLIRVPVQIHSSAAVTSVDRGKSFQAIEDSIQTELSGLMVVKAPKVNLRVGKKVVGTCRIGDVVRELRRHDPWVLVEDATQKGWVRGTDLIPFEDASGFFERMIEEDPQNAAAYCARGRFVAWIAERTREHQMLATFDQTTLRDVAWADFNRAVRLDPKEPLVYIGRGLIFGQKGEHEKALADLDTALRLAPDSAEALRYRAIAKTKLDDFDGAIADCNRAIDLDPTDAFAFDQRALAYGLQEEWDKGLADCNRAIELNPKFASAYFNRGSLWAGKGDDDRAFADYNEAVRLGHDAARVNRARIFYQRGQLEEAIADFDVVIPLDPNNPVHYYRRGTARLLLGQYDEAIADLDVAIELNPNSAEAYAYRGVSWLVKKNDSKALADFDTAIEIDPRCAVALVNRGSYWKSKEVYAKAISDYRDASRLMPDKAAIHNSLGWILATCPEAEFRDGVAALESATRACELSDWNHPTYLATLAAAHAELGDFEKAVHWQTKSLGLTPGAEQEKAQKVLELFRKQEPYRDTDPATIELRP